jgi:hypothetical protein
MSGSRSVLLVMDFQHGVVERFADSSVLDAVFASLAQTAALRCTAS